MRLTCCLLTLCLLAELSSPPCLADCGPDNSNCLIGAVGDFDLDGDRDGDDFAFWESCVNGPDIGLSQPCASSDADGDLDVDLFDLAALQAEITGACTCPPNLLDPEARIDVDNYLGIAPHTVNFNATRSSDVEAVIANYDWEFGDGTVASGLYTSHLYQAPGTFDVTLTVTDAGGLTSQAVTTVTISDGNFSLLDPVTLNEARRLLWQAGFGPTQADITYITQFGFEAWIDAQMALPVTRITAADQQSNDDKGYGGSHPGHIWNDICVEGADQLRQRMAWALIQIIVLNLGQADGSYEGGGFYYSEYMEHAFGNYRDLLGFVTLSQQMGYYLTYIGNEKADAVSGSMPDENYAREVMQLFSIGLWQLNPDGTRKLDQDGNPMPTYDIEDIKQFARVFTGLHWNFTVPGEERPLNPMLMVADRHEFGDKQLLDYPGAVPPNGYIPARPEPDHTVANAMQDITDALDNIFYHPNTAPFISKQLIQLMVTSNPTPAYVQRVAEAFEGFGPYGSGVRGDLAATVKAILLDNEARDPAYRSNPYYGKLHEPLVIRWGLYRVLERVDRVGETFPFRIEANFWSDSEVYGQEFLASPTVFNFYPPDYAPPSSELDVAGMVSPALNIMNDYTAIATINYMRGESIVAENDEEGQRYDVWRPLAGNPTLLVGALNNELMFGSLSPEAEQIIVDAVTQIADDTNRVRTAVWLMVNSPEFRVLR
jgi:uncharacterized protein (DUF1800 family)